MPGAQQEKAPPGVAGPTILFVIIEERVDP
jgi:hypothetical protein